MRTKPSMPVGKVKETWPRAGSTLHIEMATKITTHVTLTSNSKEFL